MCTYILRIGYKRTGIFKIEEKADSALRTGGFIIDCQNYSQRFKQGGFKLSDQYQLFMCFVVYVYN